MARENGGIVFLLLPEDWVLKRPWGHQGSIGVTVDDIAGGGDDVWNRPSLSLKRVPLSDTGKWETGKIL